MTPTVAGVDIGGTTTQVILCAPDLTVLDRVEVPTPAAAGGTAMVGAALDAVRLLLAREETRRPGSTGPSGDTRLLGVGIGAAGVVDARAGRVLVASDSFREWAGFAVTAAVESALGVPAFLDNDVNAFLRGEATAGAVAGETHVLGMTLGTGVGGALWLDGALYDGPHGAAGEIGHVPGFGDLPCTCGGRGHLETLASGRAIAARYEKQYGEKYGERHREKHREQYRERYGDRSGQRALSARDVAKAAEDGDLAARAVFETAGTAVARAVLLTAGLLDITTVVVGGGVTGSWDLLAAPIDRALAAEPPVSGHPLRVLPAQLGGDAVAVGAAARAWAEL
ncbi:ROK family protein [Streptomyces sp. NPDC047072]|uniref:ROK family protein n=1 Tax=Streptomyces sp. NPDC047072 TaxID=3154809 RepID=UPI0033C7B0A6